jgi:hypothetical protein
VAGAALLVGLPLLGCSSNGKAVAVPSITSTPIPTVSAFPKTREGAAAFVEYYFMESNHATQSGDLSRLKALYDPSCSACSRYSTYVMTSFGGGGHIEGGQFNTFSTAAAPFEGNRVAVTVVGTQQAARVIAADGNVLQQAAAVARSELEVTVSWSGRHWLTIAISAVGKP